MSILQCFSWNVMPEWIEIFFELLAQFTGDGGGHRPGMVPYGLEGLCWLGLLLVSRFKYKNEPDPHNWLLTWGFAVGLARQVFMLSIKTLEAYGILSIDTLHIFFPPLEHAFSDCSEILIAAAYMLFLVEKKDVALRFLKFGLISVVLMYLATFWWWGEYIVANPESKFGQTWCDWVFRINASGWLAFSVYYLWKHSKKENWVRVCVCVALLFFFLDDFLKLPDMALDEVYERYFAPIRHGLHLAGVPILAYVYVRQQATAIKSAFDSLEDIVGERTAELREASKNLEVALNQQIQFTADASHELRTPVTIIMNEINWALEKERDKETYQDSFATCRIATNHMKELIESLLDLARIDAGQSHLRKDPVDLNEMCKESAKMLQPIAYKKKINLHFSPGTKAMQVMIDLKKVRQVLINLVSNAVQHSPANSNIWIRLERRKSNIVLEVQDEGPGIMEEDIPYIFDRFYRSKKARAYVEGGSGLGLAVSRAIAIAHGGDLKANNLEEKGSLFSLVLPS
ncbi:HAMP domain-containing histidine kinase [Puniceicoccaceae bacterium K14]|nr:HAMP domain-containing histidine kinase [Puniceicoccaceae bacterium K14]